MDIFELIIIFMLLVLSLSIVGGAWCIYTAIDDLHGTLRNIEMNTRPKQP